jgi:TRAP-type C4-dicarboxylate transport system substrate-binding protein
VTRLFLNCAAALVIACAGALAAGPALGQEGGGAEAAELKFGTLAPDNTPWSDILKNFKKNLQKATKGKVRVKLYLNGVLGDEAAMLQKIKFGQLTGGGFSTGGISTVVPELQVFELPFLFNSDEEADYVMDHVVLDDMRKLCEQRGLYLYIWAVNGWHDLASNERPLDSLAALKGVKAQMQETDIQRAFWTAVGANPVPLPVPETLNALERGMITSYATTPIFASAAQWFTQTKYWTDSNHIYQPAAVVFDLKWWNTLDEGTRKTILSFGPELQAAARKDVRGIDKDLMAQFKEAKIQVSELTPEHREELKKACAGIPAELIKNGVFTQALYDKVIAGLQEYRAKQGAGGH